MATWTGLKSARRAHAVAVVVLAACCCAALAAPPPAVAKQQQSSYSAAYGHMSCDATVVIQPNTTAELAAAVAAQSKAADSAGRTLKIRATHKKFHSTNAFNCPAGSSNIYTPDTAGSTANGRSPDVSVAILLDNMNNLLDVDLASRRVKVQAGMTVKQLLDQATRLGMSVPLGAMPAFADLMLGGVLLTGAHGSNFMSRSNLGDIVIDITWVNAHGETRTSPRTSPEGHGIAGGLGLLGVVTELTLQLGPATHTQFDTVWKKDDDDIAADILRMLKETPRMLVVWRPDMGKYNAVRLREVPTTVSCSGATQTIELPDFLASAMGTTLRTWEELAHPPWLLEEVMCYVSKEVSISHGWASNLRGRALLSGVGPTNEMQSVSCGDRCAWDEKIANLAMWDTHFTTEIEKLPEWMADVKKIMEKDFWGSGPGGEGAPRGRCLPPGYFWLRFGSGNDDMISPATGMNGTVNLQLSFMTSKATAPKWGIKHGHVLETLEQLTLCKYKGRPHWGKNHERTYTHPNCSVPALYPQIGKLLDLQSKHDPMRVFEPPLFTKMLAHTPPRYGPKCALSGTCFCREDSHCGPGRACVASAAFPEYRSCRRVATDSAAAAARSVLSATPAATALAAAAQAASRAESAAAAAAAAAAKAAVDFRVKAQMSKQQPPQQQQVVSSGAGQQQSSAAAPNSTTLPSARNSAVTPASKPAGAPHASKAALASKAQQVVENAGAALAAKAQQVAGSKAGAAAAVPSSTAASGRVKVAALTVEQEQQQQEQQQEQQAARGGAHPQLYGPGNKTHAAGPKAIQAKAAAKPLPAPVSAVNAAAANDQSKAAALAAWKVQAVTAQRMVGGQVKAASVGVDAASARAQKGATRKAKSPLVMLHKSQQQKTAPAMGAVAP